MNSIRKSSENWIGKKFNKLLVLENSINSKVYCECECGKRLFVNVYNLNNGHTSSCGCNMGTHHKSYSRMYGIWKAITSRCNNPKSTGYEHYGGRGIKCEWKSFEEYYNDMYETYKDGLSIDRINVNGNYCKNNCRWATRTEQANNKRVNHIISYNGITKTISEWANYLDMKQNTLYYRIKRGWTYERALK